MSGYGITECTKHIWKGLGACPFCKTEGQTKLFGDST